MKGKGLFSFTNPIVDSFAFVDDAFLEKHNFKKGDILLISKEEGIAVAKELKFENHVCGGSSMNVARGVGLLGYPSTVIGQYSDDDRAEIVKEALRKCNVTNRLITKPGISTTEAIIMVTPDAARTIYGLDGASSEPYIEKVETSVIDDYDLILTDGFQLAYGSTCSFVIACLERAKSLNKKTALVLASAFGMPGYKEALLKALNNITILSGTIDEHLKLFEKDNLEVLLKYLEKSHFELCAVTMDARGSYIIMNGKSLYIPAPEVPNIIDTTGAGDCYACGLLYGYLCGYPVEIIAKIVNTVAGYTIARVGVCLEPDLKDEVSKVLPSK